MVLGASFWGRGNLSAAKDAFKESLSVGQLSGNKLVEVSGACNVAYSIEMEGQPQEALEIFQEILQLTEQGERALPVAGLVHVEIARVLS